MLINEKTILNVRNCATASACVLMALYNSMAPVVYAAEDHSVSAGDLVAYTADQYEATDVASCDKEWLSLLNADLAETSPETVFIPDMTVCSITSENCIAFDSPDMSGEYVTTIEEGTEVVRTGIGSNVDRVVTEDGREVYVVKSCTVPSSILPEEPEEEVVEEVEPGQQIADIAVSMIGTPYLYAGASENGVDCSGLVVYCYARMGVELPHYSGSLCSVGEEVSEDDLRPGDIICWNNGGGHCGHVGIYVGDGQCVDARGHRDGVIYADLDLHPILTVRRIFT